MSEKPTKSRVFYDIHSLMPSDIRAIAIELDLQDDRFLSCFKGEVAAYFASIKSPSAADLDDISRISAQLNKAKFWMAISPKAFLNEFSSNFDEGVVKIFCNIFKCDLSYTKVKSAVVKKPSVRLERNRGVSREFSPGDNLVVKINVKDGHVIAYDGVCIARQGSGLNEWFTVRKISRGVAVERNFSINSPEIVSIHVVRKRKVRFSFDSYHRGRNKKRLVSKSEPGRIQSVSRKVNLD